MSLFTERLYYENSYETAFDANVIERRRVKDRGAVILDRTCFYPASGGQPHDGGTLNGITVCEVIEDGAAIVHVLEDSIKDDRVHGEIDRDRRFDHMQQHTGQHILTGSFIRILDSHTASFHMSEDISSIDISRSPGTPEEWDAVERQVDQVISRNLPVKMYRVDPEQVEGLDLRKIPEREGGLRIVDIEGFDRTACGGTHCASTGEVGVVRLMNHRPKRVHGGLYRVEFRCGRRALMDYARKISLVNDLTGMLGVGEAELHLTIRRLVEERKQTEKALDDAQERLLDVEATELLNNITGGNTIRIVSRVFPGRDLEDLGKLAQRIIQRERCITLFGGGENKPQLVFARSEGLDFHMGELVRDATRLIGGKGGGRPDTAMGGGPDMDAIEKAIQWARKHLTHPL